MNKAIEIAKWIILENSRRKLEIKKKYPFDDYVIYEDMTHFKIQNLLFFIQGLSLYEYNQRVFSEDIEIYGNKVIVKKVFNKFKIYGQNEIKIEMN